MDIFSIVVHYPSQVIIVNSYSNFLEELSKFNLLYTVQIASAALL